MSLSINKLEELLQNNSILIKTYYVIDSLIIYIEVFSIINSNSFLIYIPSKYSLKPDPHKSIYKLKYLNIEEKLYSDNTYTDEIDNFDLSEYYNEITVNNDNQNLKENLTENYNHPLPLKNINKKDNSILRKIFRQLERMLLCVQNINYKICILYKNYLCCMTRNNDFTHYIIRKYEGVTNKKIMLSIDLENIYKGRNSVSTDIKTIYRGIYKILENNQNKYLSSLERLLDYKNNIVDIYSSINTKKNRYSDSLKKLETLLKSLNIEEKKIIEKIMYIRENKNNSTLVRNDIQTLYQLKAHETKIDNINQLKHEIICNILSTRQKYEELILDTDTVFFDNILMIDTINRNFSTIKNL